MDPQRLVPLSDYQPSSYVGDMGEDSAPTTMPPSEVAKVFPPPAPEHAMPSVEILDLISGIGGYQNYIFQLTPEQLKLVRQIIVDAIEMQVKKLRENL